MLLPRSSAALRARHGRQASERQTSIRSAPAPLASSPAGERRSGERHRCRAAGPQGSGSSPQEERYAYSDPVNKALGNFLPTARAAEAELTVEWDAPKAKGLALQALADRFAAEFLRREWFVTGDVPAELFSDDFAFKDESVATSGIKSYALGVRKLFDQSTARAELIRVEADEGARTIVAVWRLEGKVNLPFKPTIPPYVVTTTLGVGPDGLIKSQVDAFSAPGWQLLAGALLGAWAGPAPAAPVAELRAKAAAEGLRGVVAPPAAAAKAG